VDVRILGPLEVVRDGVALDLGRTQQRVLLARLVVAGGHPVSVDRLADDLWGDHPPGRPDVSLQALVSRLRRVLEPDRAPRDPARVLVTRSPGYAVQLPGDAVDAVRFTRLAAEGSEALTAGDAPRALPILEAALGLWRGEVLADMADHAFVRDVAATHVELQDAAREHHATALLATGSTARALSELEALTRDRPLRERPWELLLTALHRAGRTAEALERFREVRARFAEELGLDPGPGLRALEAGLLRGELPATPAMAFPAAAVTVVAPTPAPTTSTTAVARTPPKATPSWAGPASWPDRVRGDPGRRGCHPLGGRGRRGRHRQDPAGRARDRDRRPPRRAGRLGPGPRGRRNSGAVAVGPGAASSVTGRRCRGAAAGPCRRARRRRRRRTLRTRRTGRCDTGRGRRRPTAAAGAGRPAVVRRRIAAAGGPHRTPGA
jgi:DNA-binding SARP family transcriptional activator